MARRPYPRLGELITYLVRALVLITGKKIGYVMDRVASHLGFSPDMLFRWRRGELRPSDETLEQLARLGKEEAKLDRVWGESLLRAAGYPLAEQKVDEIWGARVLRAVPNNLVPRLPSPFLGREEVMARLMKLLSPTYATHAISVDGIGGVGKTTLVLEAAHRCLEASTGQAPHPQVPTFEAIVYVTAKQHTLTPHGVLARHQMQRTLRDIFHEIAHTLDRDDITLATPEEQPARVRRALARQRTLLILDNMETIEDRTAVLEFIYDLPPGVKVLITTRELLVLAPIRLEQLPKEESLALIRHEADEKKVKLTEEEAQLLHERVGGVPAALVYVVGRMAGGYSVAWVLQSLAAPSNDIAQFCFEGSVAPLRGQPAHCLLMARAMFPQPPLRAALVQVAGLQCDPLAADKGLALLHQLSLVTPRDGRLEMLPLTREFALAELAAHPDFEQAARERWVGWYRNLVQVNGGRVWDEWHLRYSLIEEEWVNCQAVFEWCATKQHYDDLRFFWSEEGISSFANLYGYWNERLVWLEWLLEAAERRGDIETVVAAICEKSWTHIIMGDSSHWMKAQTLLEQAWGLRDFVRDPHLQSDLINNFAVLCLYQARWDDALYWLNACYSWLSQSQFDQQDYIYHLLPVIYYHAELHYRQNEYQEARILYLKILDQAKQVGWQRALIYIQGGLANVMIAEDNLEEAEGLLQAGLKVVQRNRDKRRTSLFKRSYAHLEQKRGNREAARQWALEALDGFERLGMQPEMEEMQRFLQAL